MGILVFMLAIMPLGDERTMYLMKAEAPGPLVSKPGAKGKIDSKNPVYDLYCTDTGGDDFAVCRWNALF